MGETAEAAPTLAVPSITALEKQVVDSDKAIIVAIARQVLEDTDEVGKVIAIEAKEMEEVPVIVKVEADVAKPMEEAE